MVRIRIQMVVKIPKRIDEAVAVEFLEGDLNNLWGKVLVAENSDSQWVIENVATCCPDATRIVAGIRRVAGTDVLREGMILTTGK
jgi:hypothetical protein